MREICISLVLLVLLMTMFWVVWTADLTSVDFWFSTVKRTARWVAASDSVPMFAVRATIATGGARWALSKAMWIAKPFVWVWRQRVDR